MASMYVAFVYLLLLLPIKIFAVDVDSIYRAISKVNDRLYLAQLPDSQLLSLIHIIGGPSNHTVTTALNAYADQVYHTDIRDIVNTWILKETTLSGSWFTAPIDVALASLIDYQAWKLQQSEPSIEEQISNGLFIEQALAARDRVLRLTKAPFSSSVTESAATPVRSPDDYLLFLRKSMFHMGQGLIIGAFCFASSVISCVVLFSVLIPASLVIWISVLIQFRRM